MQTLLAVLVDLWHFARGRHTVEVTRAPIALPPPNLDGAVSDHEPGALAPLRENDDEWKAAWPRPRTDLTDDELLEDTLYVAWDEVLGYAIPQVQFDAHTTRVPFGTRVVCHALQAGMIRITDTSPACWITRASVTNDRHVVWPTLHPGAYYGPADIAVHQLRSLINDEFGAGAARLPLQAPELVTLRLVERERRLPWPVETGPRRPGRWRGLLAGTTGVRLTASPTAGAVMEWMDGDGSWQLGFVTTVSPDETITLVTVVHGYYAEQMWFRTQWEASAPTFITVQ